MGDGRCGDCGELRLERWGKQCLDCACQYMDAKVQALEAEVARLMDERDMLRQTAGDAVAERDALAAQIGGFPHVDDLRRAMLDTADENDSLRKALQELVAPRGVFDEVPKSLYIVGGWSGHVRHVVESAEALVRAALAQQAQS